MAVSTMRLLSQPRKPYSEISEHLSFFFPNSLYSLNASPDISGARKLPGR